MNGNALRTEHPSAMRFNKILKDVITRSFQMRGV